MDDELRKQLRDVIRELERHQRVKRGKETIEDRALHFRVQRIVKDKTPSQT